MRSLDTPPVASLEGAPVRSLESAQLLTQWWRRRLLKRRRRVGQQQHNPLHGGAREAAASVLAQWWREQQQQRKLRVALQQNPLLAAMHQESSEQRKLWRRWVDEEGVCFWHQPSTGKSAWEVPEDGRTLCGWQWQAGRGAESASLSAGSLRAKPHWVHLPSQCFSALPPFLNEGRAAALIERHRQRQAAAAEAAEAGPSQ